MPTDSKPALVASLRNMSIQIFERTDIKNGVVYRGLAGPHAEDSETEEMIRVLMHPPVGVFAGRGGRRTTVRAGA